VAGFEDEDDDEDENEAPLHGHLQKRHHDNFDPDAKSGITISNQFGFRDERPFY
jgi:hypothetical protein